MGTKSSPLVSLTPSDSLTLSRLFNPEAAPPTPESTLPISTSLPADSHYPSSTLSAILTQERTAVSLADSVPEKSLELLNALISAFPLYASAYNNRAQLRRILKQPNDNVLSDLDRAVELASEGLGENGNGRVSEHQARVLKNAYTQRGAVREIAGKESDAKQDMEEAAKWGSEVAKQWLVARNPYARLCGQIVNEVMRKEIGGAA